MWVASATGEPNPRRVASDIRVDESFLHVSPSWTPDSSRVWFVSTRGENGYHPLQWWDRSGETGQADYPRELTTATNVAVCPDPSRPLIAFIAAGDPAIDVYLALMSHL